MEKFFAEEGTVYRLQEYAILEKGDGVFEYKAWPKTPRSDKLTWIRGFAVPVEDYLCLTSIQTEGDEEDIETELELKVELEQLPEWDKTKFFCVVVAGIEASLLKYCGTGNLVKKGSEEYKIAQEKLKEQGLKLLGELGT
jgi:hypothetical protein